MSLTTSASSVVWVNQSEHVPNSLPFLIVKYLYPPVRNALPHFYVVKKLHSVMNRVNIAKLLLLYTELSNLMNLVCAIASSITKKHQRL